MAGDTEVSAREQIENLWDRAVPVGPLLDAYAHELAERIRDGYTGDGPDEDNWILSAFDAAKLIDPEAGP